MVELAVSVTDSPVHMVVSVVTVGATVESTLIMLTGTLVGFVHCPTKASAQTVWFTVVGSMVPVRPTSSKVPPEAAVHQRIDPGAPYEFVPVRKMVSKAQV